MEEFKSITGTSPTIKIATCLQKIYKKITESRSKNILEHNIKEIEFLRNQCKAESVNLCLLSCQTFVRLVENGSLDIPSVLTMFVGLLPNSSFSQYTAITESIVSLLLLNLKRQLSQLKDDQKFACSYGIKTSQHPLITLIQNDGSNMIDVANKLNGICNHHDNEIKMNSIEFLRPVFLYILCNPQTLPDSKTVWTGLLAQSKVSPEAGVLVREILSWSKITSPNSCLFTSMILIETIEHFTNQSDNKQAAEMSIFLALVTNHLISYSIDPRPSLHCIYRVLHTTQVDSKNIYNVLLVIMSQTLHIISPVYLPELLRIIAFVVITQNCGNQYILNMILDGTIQWMAQTAFIPADGLASAQQIITKIMDNEGDIEKISTTDFNSDVRNFHPDIALAFDIAKLAESFDESEYKNIFTFVDTLNVKSKTGFSRRINFFLRALFLSKEPSLDCWVKNYQTILSIVKTSEDIALDFIMTYIFKLATETYPEIQLELLRGLPHFAVSKDNIPIILNTLKTLTYGPNVPFAMDLYLRLWKLDVRTYPFLLKVISKPANRHTNYDEYVIAKASVIRDICQERPSQYGPDLVADLSNILNKSTSEAGSLATSLALDAIVSLCESNTVNIVSTWKALSGKFRHEKRIRVLESLYKFFSQVPLLQTPTVEYEELLDESLDHLWLVIAKSKEPIQIKAALNALKNYELGATLTFKHIPPKFRKNLASGDNFDSIPGEVWVQLLQGIKPTNGEDAADLISHYIAREIASFRSGVYRVPERRPEPHKITGLLSNSIVRAVVSYLVSQARYGDRTPEPIVVTNALRAISKKFSKPIPPVDWSFLSGFFHLSYDARKYCILITKNQILHSGTAKRLLENFLVDFEPNCFEEDLLLLFTILPEIAIGVSLPIFKAFMEKISLYCFKESQLNGFVEGCLFEKFLDSIKYVFQSKCDIPEVLDLLTLIVERYLDSMELDSRLFERYTEVVASLHPHAIDSLTSPSNWWEIPIGKLKKATIIRCYLVLYNTQIENPLKWLDPIIDAFADKLDEQTFFFRHLSITLFAYNDDKTACSWIMEMFLKMQALLADASSEQKTNKVAFYLDIFVISVVVLSGCAVLLGNLNTAATSQSSRNEIFPESLQMLCEHVFWKDNEAKIYEFLHHLFKNSSIPENYREMFRESIICSRNKPYFDNKAVWTKYLGIRK